MQYKQIFLSIPRSSGKGRQHTAFDSTNRIALKSTVAADATKEKKESTLSNNISHLTNQNISNPKLTTPEKEVSYTKTYQSNYRKTQEIKLRLEQ